MLFWAYPITLWLGYLGSHIYWAVQSQIPNSSSLRRGKSKRINRCFFFLHVALSVFIVATVVITIHFTRRSDHITGWTSKEYLSSTIGVGLFYLAGLLPDPDTPYTVSEVQCYIWLISVVFEAAWLCLCMRSQPSANQLGRSVLALQVTFVVLRIAVLFFMIFLYWASTPRDNLDDDAPRGERESLINGYPENAASYGTSGNQSGSTAHLNGNDAQSTTWLDYLLGFSKLVPFLWPADSKLLQVRAISCCFLLIAQRVVNILAPHQLGVVVASLGLGEIPHVDIMLYVFFRGLQGQQGVIGSIRALLWIPISQSTYRRLSLATFEHVLNLSLDFHLSKRIGEVTSALSKGGALNTFLDGLVFQLFPMVADLWIAAAYFFIVFDAFYALMVIAVTWLYIYVTIYMAKYRGRARREMTKREREMEAAKTDALLSYEVMHQNGAVPMEVSTYKGLISHFQKAEHKVFFSLNLLNALQNGVFTLGTLLLCYLSAYQISMDLQAVAMFVTLLTYLAQLQAPLSFFGSFYTQVQNNLVDAERMLELFSEKPTVTNKDGSGDNVQCDGGISFSNVCFAYGRHQALKDVSFDVMPGTSTAIVGESGSGKSTILRLLFRFYDVDSGQVNIDGIDVRDIRIENLRRHIGVVPQDTILFNDTLMNNLLYAKPESSPEDVYAACTSASIHHKILDFPNGYLTVVGERGLKLSVGERQRIAIARAFLRSPRILLLDEATASLDSETERQIQGSLEKVAGGRTTIMVAHRLSTITKADQIIVLQKGRIVERGSHVELLARNGQYAQMWNRQTEAKQMPQPQQKGG